MDLIPQFQTFINDVLLAAGVVLLAVGIGFQIIKFFDDMSQVEDE
jgi:hypothetical protein